MDSKYLKSVLNELLIEGKRISSLQIHGQVLLQSTQKCRLMPVHHIGSQALSPATMHAQDIYLTYLLLGLKY